MRKRFTGWRVDYDGWQASVRLDRKVREALAERAWLDLGDPTERRLAGKMFESVDAHLNECVYLLRSVTLGPKRAHQIERLRVVLGAQRDLVRAIESLDDWSWDHELEPQIDQDRCPLPDDPKNNGVCPLVPIAVTELGAAVEAVIDDLRSRPRHEPPSAARLRDDCVKALARVFHENASPEFSKAENRVAYRNELVGQTAATAKRSFIATALRAAALPVPEPRKIWACIPREFRAKRAPRR
jgi:hypothetical protein